MFASQVIDMQADLLVRLQEDNFRFILSNVLTANEPDQNMGRIPDPTKGQKIVSAVLNHVKAAEAYHVNEDMSLLIRHAASLLDDEDVVDLSLAPTCCGIVRLDKPLPMTDVRGAEMLIHWITWGPSTVQYLDGGTDTGLLVTYWNDLLEPDSVALKIFSDMEKKDQAGAVRLKRSLGRWAVVSASVLTPGTTLGEMEVAPPADAQERVIAEGDTPSPFTNPQRYVHALWLLLNQTIVSVKEESLTGPFKKRAAKQNLPSKVTVVSLRRTESPNREDGETHVEWSHRWVVRGHWRWQAYGPGRSERRRIWVHPHVKGPEGAPLKVTDKVYSLHR